MTIQKNHMSRLIGAILLICGTTIGAGILALPVATGRAGFVPSIFTMLFCWAYLAYAAFCILEVNLSLPSKGNIISMASATLGKWGKWVSWSAYLFLLYALNTAYIAVSTSIFQNVLEKITGLSIVKILCVLPLLAIFGLLLRQGMKVIDTVNRLFMIGLGVCFLLLLGFSIPRVSGEGLTAFDMSLMLPSLSVVLTAFGYHIIIPSLVTYLHGNVKELKLSIWIGSFIPLIVYIVWQVAILGIVPVNGPWSIEDAYQKGMSGTDLLIQLSNHSWVPYIAEGFAFFVIITSFLGVSVSLFDFLADGLHIEKKAEGKWKLLFFTFVPPLYFALSYPRVFFSALEYAGAFGVVILLALIPGCMVYRKRYALNLPSSYRVAGGKIGLIIFISISTAIVLFEALCKFGVLS